MGDRVVTFAELAARNALEIGAGRPRSEPAGLPVLRVADVLEGRIQQALEAGDSAVVSQGMGSKASRPGDIVLTTKGTVGRIAIMPADGPTYAYSPQLCYFRLTDGDLLDRRFLYYWFKSTEFWKQADQVKGQTDMADFISLQDINSLRMQLSPLTEQRSIAEVLGALDDKIAANDRVLAVCDELCAALVERASRAGEERRLRDVLDLNYGKALPAAQRVQGAVGVYGSGGLSGQHNQALVERSGVVLGRKGTVGAVYWADGPHFPIDTTYFVDPTPGMPAEVIYYLLRRMPLRELNSDSAVPGLNREEAYAQPLRVPSQDNLDALQVELSEQFAMMVAVREENKRLAATRDELLPLLMSGKVRMKDISTAVPA